MYEIRKILASDRKRVFEISKDIWEGSDYIPQIFDEWLNDQDGLFLGAFYQNELIGFQKLSFLSKGNAWLEGLRKDQKTSLRGVGQALNSYFMDYLAHQEGIKSIRCASYFDNLASLRLIEKFGYRRVLTRSYKFLDPAEFNYDLRTNFSFTKAKETDLAEIESFLKGRKFFKSCNDLINLSWKIYPYSKELLLNFINQGSLYLARDEGRINFVASLFELRELYLPILEYQDFEQLAAFFKQIVIPRAKNNGNSEIGIFLTEDLNIYNDLQELGFKSYEQDNDFFLFEIPNLNIL